MRRVAVLGLMAVCVTTLCASSSADPLEEFWRTTRGREVRRLPVQVLPVNAFMSLSNAHFERPTPDLEDRTLTALAERSVYNVITLTLRSVPDLSDPITEARAKHYFERAHAAGIRVLMDIDARIARREFLRRYPDDCARVICTAVSAPTNGAAGFSVVFPSYRDHMAWGAERGYDASGGEVVEAFSVRVDAAGVADPATKRSVAERLYVHSVSNAVTGRVDGLAADERLVTLVAFRLFAVDPASPRLMPFLEELARRYHRLGADGAMRDDWGFPPIRDFNADHTAFPHSPAFAAEYARVSGGRDYLADLALLPLPTKGAESARYRIVDSTMRTIHGVAARTEREFYDLNHRVFGADVYVTKHPTWHCRFDSSEFMHNGLDWWAVKRDWAQSDEAIPLPFVTGMAKKCGGPCWMNEGYGPNADHYGRALWRYALCGGRMVYHGIYGTKSTVLRDYADPVERTYHSAADLLTPGNVRAQTRVGLLNLVTRAQIECPVGLVFGHWRTMNWLDPAYRDDALGLAHGLGGRGWYVDAYPSSELAAGTFAVDADGFLRVGGQRYAALVLHRLGDGDAADFAKVVGTRTLKTRLFSWDSPACAGTVKLASGRDVEPIVRTLEQVGAVRQTPLSETGLHGKGLDRLPNPDGTATFADGTVARIRGASPDLRGDALDGFAQPLRIGGKTISFTAEGLFAARLGADGNLEALAAGGLRKVEAPGLSLALDRPEDVVLVRRGGRWQGLWQTTRRLADLPANLSALTDDWRVLTLPTGVCEEP